MPVTEDERKVGRAMGKESIPREGDIPSLADPKAARLTCAAVLVPSNGVVAGRHAAVAEDPRFSARKSVFCALTWHAGGAFLLFGPGTRDSRGESLSAIV